MADLRHSGAPDHSVEATPSSTSGHRAFHSDEQYEQLAMALGRGNAKKLDMETFVKEQQKNIDALKFAETNAAKADLEATCAEQQPQLKAFEEKALAMEKDIGQKTWP